MKNRNKWKVERENKGGDEEKSMWDILPWTAKFELLWIICLLESDLGI